jgi:hypothetical protein
MKARVATFEGGDPAVIQQNVDSIKERSASGPPEGLPSVGLLMLQRDDKLLAISLFDTEEDLQQGEATLNSMSPPAGEMGRRVSVEHYDVAIKLDADRAAS